MSNHMGPTWVTRYDSEGNPKNIEGFGIPDGYFRSPPVPDKVPDKVPEVPNKVPEVPNKVPTNPEVGASKLPFETSVKSPPAPGAKPSTNKVTK